MQKQVRDLMLPLEEYGIVSETDTLFDALMKLDFVQQNLAPGTHRPVPFWWRMHPVEQQIAENALCTKRCIDSSCGSTRRCL